MTLKQQIAEKYKTIQDCKEQIKNLEADVGYSALNKGAKLYYGDTSLFSAWYEKSKLNN